MSELRFRASRIANCLRLWSQVSAYRDVADAIGGAGGADCDGCCVQRHAAPNYVVNGFARDGEVINRSAVGKRQDDIRIRRGGQAASRPGHVWTVGLAADELQNEVLPGWDRVDVAATRTCAFEALRHRHLAIRIPD